MAIANQNIHHVSRKKKPSGFLIRNISGWMLIMPSVLLFIVLVWRPILIGISYSFFELKGFEPVSFIGLKNYADVLSDTNFIQTLKNTVAYVGYSLLIGFPIPFICAIILNELVHAQGYFKTTTYLPAIIPSIAICMIWKMIYMDGEGGLLNMILYYFGISPVGWLSNKHLAIPMIIIMMSWHGFGATLIMYLATLQSVNNELYEAARLDGAGIFRRIQHVLFPHMKGLLLLMLVKQIIGVFNVTEQPLTMIGGGPNGASMSLGLTNYYYAFQYGQYDKALALSKLFLIKSGVSPAWFVSPVLSNPSFISFAPKGVPRNTISTANKPTNINGNANSIVILLGKQNSEIQKCIKNLCDDKAIDLEVKTVHKSKGEQADCVIIAEVNEGNFPLIHPDNYLFSVFGETSMDVISDEMRLYYVAITRTKKDLFILYDESNKSSFLM